MPRLESTLRGLGETRAAESDPVGSATSIADDGNALELTHSPTPICGPTIITSSRVAELVIRKLALTDVTTRESRS